MVGVGAQVGKDGAQEQQPAFACNAKQLVRLGQVATGLEYSAAHWRAPLVAWLGAPSPRAAVRRRLAAVPPRTCEADHPAIQWSQSLRTALSRQAAGGAHR